MWQWYFRLVKEEDNSKRWIRSWEDN